MSNESKETFLLAEISRLQERVKTLESIILSLKKKKEERKKKIEGVKKYGARMEGGYSIMIVGRTKDNKYISDFLPKRFDKKFLSPSGVRDAIKKTIVELKKEMEEDAVKVKRTIVEYYFLNECNSDKISIDDPLEFYSII